MMSYGLSYDSDEGRNVAAAITAIITGEAYKVSAEIARSVGAFPMFEKNREPMLEVIKMHREHIKKIDVSKMPAGLRYLTSEAWDCWTDALELGEKYARRRTPSFHLNPMVVEPFLTASRAYST